MLAWFVHFSVLLLHPSCCVKLFTSILNARLNNFTDAHSVHEENQPGLRAGYSTMDHIFVLRAKTQKKKIVLFVY